MLDRSSINQSSSTPINDNQSETITSKRTTSQNQQSLFDTSIGQGSNNNNINPFLSAPSFANHPISSLYPAGNISYFKTAKIDQNKNNQLLNKIEETFNLNGNVSDNWLSDTNKIGNSNFPRDIPKLQNIVSTANMRCLLDLREIALRTKNAEYNPRRFAAVIMRIKEPKTTALIFASGKMVCTGARSEEDSKKATRQYAKIIHKLGFPVKFSEFKIQNIVASCDVKFPIRLEGLASKYLKFSSYEPEMFPGLIFHMAEPKIVLLIFVSGRIVWTGAKYREDIYKAFHYICPVLEQFKKKEILSLSTDLSAGNDKEEQ